MFKAWRGYEFRTANTLNQTSKFPSDISWYNSRNIQSKLFIKKKGMQNFLMHTFSGYSLHFIVTFIIKTSVLLSRVLGKKWHFFSMWLKGASLCAYCFVPVCQCHALKRHTCRPIDKKCNFFLAPDFITSMISQCNGEYP